MFVKFVKLYVVYFIDNFEDNHDTVRDHLVTGLVKVMKNKSLVVKKQRNFNTYELGSATLKKLWKFQLGTKTFKNFVSSTAV